MLIQNDAICYSAERQFGRVRGTVILVFHGSAGGLNEGVFKKALARIDGRG
jgi:hypothetical protein